MGNHLRRYDLVILGATGFVGQILCRYLLERVGTTGPIRWAIAGRSPDKLAALTAELGVALPHLIADAADAVSLRALCAQTRAVISTVGPYALHGESLVQACAQTGTDYGDLTGEPQWVRRMIERYHSVAQGSGSRIVHCCGFDSIPSDLGVHYLQQQAQQCFGQPCNRVKMRVKAIQGGVSGGTIASGLNIVQDAIADPQARQALDNPYSLCPDDSARPHPPALVPIEYDPDFRAWVTPFVMAAINTRVVLRSNALLGYPYGKAFQYEEALLTGPGAAGWLAAQGLKVTLGGMAAATAFPPARWLSSALLPKPGEGPSQMTQDQGFYDLRFLGTTASGNTIRAKVTGDRDPGYGSTAKILGQVGLCLAENVAAEMPGGSWTPAALFGSTLTERLVQAAGLTFEGY